MKKLLITGASGFLGSRLMQYYEGKYEVIGITRKDVDFTKEQDVIDHIQQIHPDVVLHCAAISDTGYAQNHPAESYQVNVETVVWVAKGCKLTGAKLVYMSSDQVYTGYSKLGAISETEELTPENVYGRDKLKAEQLLQEMGADAVGLRLTWMYDLPNRHLKTNSNLLWNIIRAALRQEKLCFRTGDYRGITYVWEVVERMEQIWCLPSGVYNCGSENAWNTYDTAIFAVKQLGYTKVETLIDKEDNLLRGEFRNISINIEKMKKYGIHFPDTQEGIKRCLLEYGYIVS